MQETHPARWNFFPKGVQEVARAHQTPGYLWVDGEQQGIKERQILRCKRAGKDLLLVNMLKDLLVHPFLLASMKHGGRDYALFMKQLKEIWKNKEQVKLYKGTS